MFVMYDYKGRTVVVDFWIFGLIQQPIVLEPGNNLFIYYMYYTLLNDSNKKNQNTNSNVIVYCLVSLESFNISCVRKDRLYNYYKFLSYKFVSCT